MPKRSAAEAHLAAVVPAPKVDGALKSRSGRTVKPKVWDDGTLAAPLAALKEDAAEPSPGAEKAGGADADAADPDFSLHQAQAAASDSARGGSGGRASSGAAPHSHPQQQQQHQHQYSEEDEEAYSDDSPRASAEGSQGGNSSGRARSGSVGRDEHGKFTSGPRPRGSRGGARGGRGEGGGIFKMAAVEVLRLEKRLMSTGEIARVALKRGLIKCTGKTPEATMASALYTDIKRKEGQSIFIRPHEGLFGLREWIEQGVAFQDEFAEEMAKRARAAFGAFVAMPGMPPMMPPMVDSEGVPISTPFPPMMPYAGVPPMPGMPMPMPLVPPPAAAAAAAAAAKAGAGGDDSPDGLMELLSAAEELHKSSSQDADEADVKYAADGTALPATSAGAAAAAADAPQLSPRAQQAAAAPMDLEQPASSRGRVPATAAPPAAADEPEQAAGEAAAEEQPGGAASRSQSAADGDAAGDDEDDDAAAMLAAVAEAAAEQPPSRRSPDEEAAAAAALQGFQGFALPDGAAAGGYGGMPYVPPPYGYPPYPYYPYMYNPATAAALPPLPKATGRRGAAASPAAVAFAEADAAAVVAELAAGSSGSLDLTVRGSNRPFTGLPTGGNRGGAAAAAALAAMQTEGQEQVNILNLPLPEADMQGGQGAGGAPAADVDPAKLKEAEVQVMKLEKELGTSHPEVGKAYLSLSRLYLAGCEESSSKQLAVAALSRSWEILNVCQLVLKRQPSCNSSFSYLMEKMRAAEVPRFCPAAVGLAAGATPAQQPAQQHDAPAVPEPVAGDATLQLSPAPVQGPGTAAAAEQAPQPMALAH